MSTDIRPELSKHSKYYLNRHRYYELKHFCLQYPEWKKLYSELDALARQNNSPVQNKNTSVSSPVEKCIEKRLFYSERMEMVEKAAAESCSDLSDYILAAVTKGLSYEIIKLRLEIPCCKDTYYALYRRFFWTLDRIRQ